MVTTVEEEQRLRSVAHELYDVMWSDLVPFVEDQRRLGNECDAKALDTKAEASLRARGLRPALKGYQPSFSETPYPHTICLSINDEVIHGLPEGRSIKHGDLATIDLVAERGGWFADMAAMIVYGEPSEELEPQIRLCEETRRIAEGVVAAIKPGWTTKDVAKWISRQAKAAGLNPCHDITGHGIGREIHMPPDVHNRVPKLEPIRPGFPAPPFRGAPLKPGMVVCIEPMLTYGDGHWVDGEDGWTIRTEDGALAAHWEHMVLITPQGAERLTL